jgi:hypothetical protein
MRSGPRLSEKNVAALSGRQILLPIIAKPIKYPPKPPDIEDKTAPPSSLAQDRRVVGRDGSMADSPTRQLRGNLRLAGIGLAWAIWAIIVGVAFYKLNKYQMTPGAAAAASAAWPSEVAIPLARDRATLIMFIHPQCPCSNSSLGELANVLARRGDRVAAYVAVFNPAGQADSWCQTDLWHAAEAIPEVHVLVDSGGTLARRFGVATSGQALLYDASGRLLFNGGITESRGHFGDNAGEAAVIAILDPKEPPPPATISCAVFGCPINSQPTLPMPAVIRSTNKVCSQ